MSLSDVFSALMKVRRVIAVILILAATGYKLSPMILHKSNADPVSAKKNVTPVTANDSATNITIAKNNGHDIGQVDLTNHYETCVQLGNGKECILQPRMFDKGNAEITVTFESKTSAGKIHDMIVTQVDAKSGKSVDIALGDFQLTLTPNIASE